MELRVTHAHIIHVQSRAHFRYAQCVRSQCPEMHQRNFKNKNNMNMYASADFDTPACDKGSKEDPG